MSDRNDIFQYSEEAKCGFYLVGLVDILGQKRKLNELGKISMNSPREFRAQFMANFRAIQILRKSFQDARASFLKQKEFLHSNLVGVDKEIYEYYQNEPKITFQGFSDTVIFYIDLSSRKQFLPISAIFLSLVSCSAAMASMMATGHAVRGGIDVGCGGVIYENEIYGPVLNCAHSLESKKAESPRMLVGDGLMGYLRATANTNESEFNISSDEEDVENANYIQFGSKLREKHPEGLKKYIELIKKEAKLCSNLIVKDPDQYFILDYFGQYVSQMLPRDESSSYLFSKACEFAECEKKKFKDMGNDKLHRRYIKLCSYLESRLPFWGKSGR